jgi:hypothetical protein
VSAQEQLMRYLILAVLLLSPAAYAEVYKCVDPQTGHETFTDKDCKEKTSGEPVPVDPANFQTGGKKKSGNKAWVSQDPTRSDKGASGCGSSSTGFKRNIENAQGAEQAAQGDGC